ncbi:MAG: hypothetical protein IJH67_05235 [Thermoguttaceae bacterium]|nr:hypothetical protein [Thermoguttaceae bacterium]
MKEDILKMAVKIARVIDDSAERDIALSRIAQVQAAANCPEDALDTIAYINYADIRVDALLKSLDNMQTRSCLKNESMPQMDSWLEKLMEETMAIPEINVRCPKLNAINLLILSRLDDANKALTYIKQSRNEFARMEIGRKRCKYLFAAYQLFQQMREEDEAFATLNFIQKRISEYKPVVQQGLMLGLVSHEYWKIKGKETALSFIESISNQTVQSYACLQLVELLSVSGNIKEAQQIAERLQDKKQRKTCDNFIDMGKTLIKNVLEMKGVILNLNKSLYFRNDANSTFSSQAESHSGRLPVWFSLSVSITPKKNSNDSDETDDENDNQQDEINILNEDNASDSNRQEIDWDQYDWDEYDWDSVKTKNKELEDMFSNIVSEDEEDEVWNESDDDDDSGEDWKKSSGYDEDEFVNNEDDDSVDFDDDDNVNEDNNDDVDEEEAKKNFKRNLPRFLEKMQKDFLRKFAYKGLPEHLRKILIDRLDKNDESFLNEIPKDKYFSMTEAIQGIVSFNRTLPPSLYQHFLRRLAMFFPIIDEDFYRERPPKKEKVEEFIARQEELGFDAALQEVISQGDYRFAVDCSLNFYCSRNNENLVFGYESFQ